jgi:hypothetical protein
MGGQKIKSAYFLCKQKGAGYNLGTIQPGWADLRASAII